MKKLDVDLKKEFQPSPKLKIIYKLYVLLSILIGLFTWLLPYLLINYFGMDNYLSLTSLFIAPIIAICLILPYIIVITNNLPIIFPSFTFIILPSLIFIFSQMFFLLQTPIYPFYIITQEPLHVLLPIVLVLIELSIGYVFSLYWIPKLCNSISYQLSESEIIVNKGIWFRNTTIVPYKQIINISIKQGPLFRKYDLANLEIYTAKHSNITKPEIKIDGIENFEQIRDFLMKRMKNEK
ncbi:MAG: hypothetical protein EAX96_20615 [Candidatus Lokiarchaeota archaeon]|nr:hypothetical protein [Candidatus Lokiarchaeota archaeon]